MSKKWITLGLVLALVIGATGTVSAAEQKMTREDYVAKLAEYTAGEEGAQQELTGLDAEITSLQDELAALDADMATLERDILGLVDATDAEIASYGKQLDSLVSQLEGLMALAPEELYMHHRTELEDIAEQLAELKGDKISALPEMAAKIGRIEGMLNELQDRGLRKLAQFDYEVAKGDHLWGISGKDVIYADPYMWPRIYRANRDKIEDPDLIYPEQVLAIPVAVGENQYLVTSGDFLYQIAATVYNDPTKWHKIYKANEQQIVEKDLVFPAQVLEIPAN